MSRQKRQVSQSGLYHIIFRGICRQNIFEEKADYIKLKEIIQKVIKETNAEIYAYCFMTNHVHLFLKESVPGDISKIRIIMSEISGDESLKIKEYDKEKRDSVIKKLVFEKKISKSALERATGISRGTIIRICKEM